MKRTRWLACSAALVLTGALPSESASARATIVDLGTLGGAQSIAYDINNKGQIVGMSTTDSGQVHAVMWEHGATFDLGASFPGRYSEAHAINDAGQIVGAVSNGWESRAVMWEPDGTVRDLGSFGGRWNEAWDINNDAEVTGRSWTATEAERSFLWANGTMTDISGSEVWSMAFGLNDDGHVVGTSTAGAYLWDGTMHPLGSDSHATRIAWDINNRGQIVGAGEISPRRDSAYVWQNGTTRYLASLGGALNTARAINERGQIVGDANVVDYELPLHAVLWYHDAMTELGMLPGASGTSIGSMAHGINNRGDVVGLSETASGDWHAVLWPR